MLPGNLKSMFFTVIDWIEPVLRLESHWVVILGSPPILLPQVKDKRDRSTWDFWSIGTL